MKIANLTLKNPYFLAPMAEVNDIAFRLLCKKAGAGLTWTGMINPLSKQKLYLDDKPALQLFSISTKGIPEFIKKYEKKVALFDFNLGCPAKTAKRMAFGSFMHNKLAMIEEILKTMRESTKKPITIKLRKSSETLKIIKIAEKYCDAITIHPRAQQQGYSGQPDIKFAEQIKNETSLPVIYSGNVDAKNANQFLKKFDAVMIGRAAIGNPNIFAELSGNKIKLNFQDYLKLAKKYKLPFAQIKFQAMNFTKGISGAKKLRKQIIGMKTIEEIKKLEI
jgi:tRNA-dihydrouridine synthase